MLKCASVCTYEIDDPEAAFKEIKTQLDEKISLLEHSVGVILCHPEFITSNVVKHICEKLPFDLAGITTSAQAVNGAAGELILTIFVITSDDVWFKTGMTEGLEENIDGPIKTAIDKATTGVSESPKLALIFPPLILKYSGDSYVDAVQKNIPNIPIFGTIAVDDTLTYDLSETIYKGENHRTAMSFILCYGNINPRFIVGTFPENKATPYKGEITKSSGSLVHEINNINALKYFDSIGFVDNGNFANNFNLVPFAIDQKKRADYDGIPVIRGIALFGEDGTAIFRGNVDEGSTFTLLTSKPDDVLLATRQKIEQLNDLSDVNGVLLFSCIARRMMTMCGNPLMELETVVDTIRSEIPFIMGYAGGEISPTLVRNCIPTNRFHNYSLVILII
ncbi:MAG: FIST C-terminal domain-containing protein [Spirochaetaceae bacterium]|nr:FIST C-terminal domain-containing protein [Spirochaetaceae bacterium]